jgi:hypothetical protein
LANSQPWSRPNGVEEKADTVRTEFRWRAAAKIYRFERGDSSTLCPDSQLRGDPVHEIGNRHDAAHGDGKIAVAAAAGAEGDVDVEVQRSLWWGERYIELYSMAGMER